MLIVDTNKFSVCGKCGIEIALSRVKLNKGLIEKRVSEGKGLFMATLILSRFRNIATKEQSEVNKIVLGEKVGFITNLLGCWHPNLSRPFGDGKIAYRACLSCGARKQFDTETLQTFGKFYYPPLVKRIENL